MKRHNYIFLLVLSIIIAVGCREDSIMITEEDTELPQSEDVIYQFLVVNELGDPISDAHILIATEVYTSDENGVVITQPQEVSSLGMSYKVTALEYESLIKVINGADGARISEKVILFKAKNTVIPTGGSGAIDGSGKITLPSTLKSADGSVYSGDVTVKNKYLDPDNNDFLRSAPGNLLALNTSEEYQLLASLGMYMIELYDDNGGVLVLPEGSSAKLEFPIADKHKNNIDSEIPLWYFDEVKGVWIEDGLAKVEGDVMIAEVSHFTWWNCDLPYDFTSVCLTFIDIDGDPMSGLEVEFSINGVSFGLTTTDANGNLIAKIPIGEIFEMTYYIDGQEIGTQNAGPFAEGARKEIINTILNPVIISGVAIDCGGIGVANGYGYYSTESGVNHVLIASDGSFVYYGSGMEHTLVIVDFNSNKTVEIVITEADQQMDFDLGSIEVCEEDITSKVSGYVMIDTDQDNVGDIPLAMASIRIDNTDNQTITTVVTNENGYYESHLLPGTLYYLFFTNEEEYSLISAGDETPDGDPEFDEFSIAAERVFVHLNESEHDSDNNFFVIPSGTGTVSGTINADTNGDGFGDTPAEWIFVQMSQAPDYPNVLVESDGSFSRTTESGYFALTVVEFLFGDYQMLVNIDTSPDPDGDEILTGLEDLDLIPVVLQNDEVDSDNTFVIDHSQKKTILCRVLEDTNLDGEGDTPIQYFQISYKDRMTGLTIEELVTNEFGVSILKVESQYSEITVGILESEYEIIDMIETSTDNDPFIIDGDMTKMEIDVETGEWDSGNIFVVRKK